MLKSPNFENVSAYEFEHPDILDFKEYRELCDATNDFRKVGIQDEESYRAIIQDERTVFMRQAGGEVPLLAPVQYEKMYDEERCLAMSGKGKAMLLAIPFAQLEGMQLEDRYEIDDDTLVIVEEFVSTGEAAELQVHDASRLPFTNAASFDFKNPDLSQYPQNETAWMAAYRFDAEPKNGPTRTYEGQPLADDFMKAWRELCEEKDRPASPDERATGTFLLSTEQLAEREDIVEQLWEISQIGFGKILGAHHPVSMEFNKQFFDKQIAANNTVTGIECVDGKVVCFGFIALDMKNNEWINDKSDVIQSEINEAQAHHRPFVHFHELIGRGEKGMGYATRILAAFLDTASKTGYPYSVFFESTNLSSLYIPPIIARDLERSDTMKMTSDIDMLGRLSYWGLVAEQAGEGEIDSHQVA